ncbi:hypothetical protein ACFOKF_22875 [Sphingobium rhizovicinum]|uniref:Ankyrin repeat domain-containing protein n=1 Tax=Sphingobium rhizovicinum TaxID=432308 RepID=A0ABV7NP99_9SPHN
MTPGMSNDPRQPLSSAERLQSLLFEEARLGRDDMIAALLQAGGDIEAVDEKGHSSLILASYHGHETTTDLLLSLGAAPDGVANEEILR